MDMFPKEELKTILETQTVGCICVSIYMPTFRPGRADVQQNPARLKNLLAQAHEQLMERGLRRPEADDYLRSAQGLLDDDFFWATMSDGLVIFLSKDYFKYYRLPVDFPELVLVADRFHIKPLLPMLNADARFYALAVSQNAVRLLECSLLNFNELDIAGKVPTSLSEALQFDNFDKEQQYHRHFGRGLTRMDSQMVSAHGAEVEETKENLERFFNLLDLGLRREVLRNDTAPLVFVGVDYLFPIYQKVNTYQHTVDKAVTANPDKMSGMDIHEQALSVIRPYLNKEQEDALRLYNESTGFKRTTNKLKRIVASSYKGKVSVLFVASSGQRWGSYDPFEDMVALHTKRKSCDVDLLDFAAAHTLAHKGKVYAVEPDKVPDGGLAAAILRL